MILDKDYEYNKEPIFYCRECGSLAIYSEDDGRIYCKNCGSTNIDMSNYFDWEEKYKKDEILHD